MGIDKPQEVAGDDTEGKLPCTVTLYLDGQQHLRNNIGAFKNRSDLARFQHPIDAERVSEATKAAVNAELPRLKREYSISDDVALLYFRDGLFFVCVSRPFVVSPCSH
jgi:hypothetical protein